MVANDHYNYPPPPANGQQLVNDAQARYTSMGCTGPINPYEHMFPHS